MTRSAAARAPCPSRTSLSPARVESIDRSASTPPSDRPGRACADRAGTGRSSGLLRPKLPVLLRVRPAEWQTSTFPPAERERAVETAAPPPLTMNRRRMPARRERAPFLQQWRHRLLRCWRAHRRSRSCRPHREPPEHPQRPCRLRPRRRGRSPKNSASSWVMPAQGPRLRKKHSPASQAEHFRLRPLSMLTRAANSEMSCKMWVQWVSECARRAASSFG